MFTTNAPAADLFMVTTRTPDQQLLITFICRDTKGLEVHDSWDAMGMRGLGQRRLVLDGCFAICRPPTLLITLVNRQDGRGIRMGSRNRFRH